MARDISMASKSSLDLPTAEKLQRARRASSEVARLDTARKNVLLNEIAARITENREKILRANHADMGACDLEGTMRNRLMLNNARIQAMADAVRDVAKLEDPVGRVLAEWTRPNGLRIRKVAVPLGVIGVIYESRPNVTVDAATLALKAGNAVVLRGGREAVRSNEALVEILNGVTGMPQGAIELLDSQSRDSAAALIRAREFVDVVIPRGGAGLISWVAENATVPVIETGAGNCHIFVDASAELDMAELIIVNAKTQRPSVCNAAEKVLLHADVAPSFARRIVETLQSHGVEVRGDAATCELAAELPVRPAQSDDWNTEYLDLTICIGVVKNVDIAIEHINRHSTHHSDAIITSDEKRAQEFLQRVDSAAVYWNASTRFTDGGEFGFGAEMGISTQKLHCRGPFALAELTSTKFEIIGQGQIRP
jgi:glutamate-5-semialdehyde dehydrogenase